MKGSGMQTEDKVQKRKISSHKYYDVWEESWLTHWEDEPPGDTTEIVAARNKNGDYIGNKEFAKGLAEYDIAPEMADPEHDACQIGWSAKHEKYFGWSHRSLIGFGVGDKVFDRACDSKLPFIERGTKTIQNKADARKAAINFAEHVS